MHPQPVFSSRLDLPLSAVRVCADFPSPAEDYIEAPLDLFKLLVGNAAATFLWRVAGWCMQDAGIHDTDILIVDRSLDPVDGDVVVAIVEGDFAVKRFRRPSGGAPTLINDNPRIPPFILAPEAAWEVWGVVTWNLPARARTGTSQAVSPRVFALSDGNAFYCSCERLFDPSLRSRPVIVLSNNDGCAIARTAEAKALGIKMGDPWHKIRERFEAAGGVARSSNYALYGDISKRLNVVHRQFSPEVADFYSATLAWFCSAVDRGRSCERIAPGRWPGGPDRLAGSP